MRSAGAEPTKLTVTLFLMQPTITRVHLLATQQNRTVDSNETISFNQEELATKAALITLTVALICLIRKDNHSKQMGDKGTCVMKREREGKEQ